MPHLSAAFSPRIVRADDENMRIESGMNLIRLSYLVLEKWFLPAPFPSNCFNYPLYDGQRTCVKQCTMKRAQLTFNKVPFNQIIVEPLNFKHISHWDTQNETLSRQLNMIEDFCRLKCPKWNCYVTHAITNHEIAPSNDLTISVFMSSLPSISIRNLIKIRFSEALIYVLSCLGTWYGVSILGLGSIVLKRSRRFIRIRKNQEPIVTSLVIERARLKSTVNKNKIKIETLSLDVNSLKQQMASMAEGIITAMPD